MVIYNVDVIEVFFGFDLVCKCLGMYIDIICFNYLVQEVIDNSVDEVLVGYVKSVQVILYQDNLLEVIDDGCGMLVDIYLEEGVLGVELIFIKLYVGGKFLNKNYQFFGGLYGVGILVVNVFLIWVEVCVKCDVNEYWMIFVDGFKDSDLEVIGMVGKCNIGISVYFWLDLKYFDLVKFLVSCFKYVFKVKVVLCLGLSVVFEDKNIGECVEWYFEDGLCFYLIDVVVELLCLFDEFFCGNFEGFKEVVSWVLLWLFEGGELVQESYVNLIFMVQGGIYVNGLCQGLFDVMCEFCEFCNLLLCGVKLVFEDVWEWIVFVFLMKMQELQFFGQIKECLLFCEVVVFVLGVVKDVFSLWFNEYVEIGL